MLAASILRVYGGSVIRLLLRGEDMKEFHGDPTVGSRLKVRTRGQKWKNQRQRWRAGETQMRDNPEEDDLQSVSAGAARSILPPFHPTQAKTKEGCDRGSEVWTVHSGRDEKGPAHRASVDFTCIFTSVNAIVRVSIALTDVNKHVKRFLAFRMDALCISLAILRVLKSLGLRSTRFNKHIEP